MYFYILADIQTDEQTFIPDVGYPEIFHSFLHFLQSSFAITKMRHDFSFHILPN